MITGTASPRILCSGSALAHPLTNMDTQKHANKTEDPKPHSSNALKIIFSELY